MLQHYTKLDKKERKKSSKVKKILDVRNAPSKTCNVNRTVAINLESNQFEKPTTSEKSDLD